MKKLATILMLVFWSISTAASASVGLSVVCIEKSGAVSFEYTAGTRCADMEQATVSGTKYRENVSAPECPSCIDSSLSASVANSAPRIAKKALAAEPAFVTVAVIKAPVYTEIHGERVPPKMELVPARSEYQTQLTTIVILQ